MSDIVPFWPLPAVIEMASLSGCDPRHRALRVPGCGRWRHGPSDRALTKMRGSWVPLSTAPQLEPDGPTDWCHRLHRSWCPGTRQGRCRRLAQPHRRADAVVRRQSCPAAARLPIPNRRQPPPCIGVRHGRQSRYCPHPIRFRGRTWGWRPSPVAVIAYTRLGRAAGTWPVQEMRPLSLPTAKGTLTPIRTCFLRVQRWREVLCLSTMVGSLTSYRSSTHAFLTLWCRTDVIRRWFNAVEVVAQRSNPIHMTLSFPLDLERW